MKTVKKMLALLLVLVLAGTALSGCSVREQAAGEISDYDSQAFVPVGDSNGTESGGAATVTGGFIVSEKKYDFEGNNLVVLNVENQTDKNYTITINGAYLDENGEVLREETQAFEGFEAGWKNYFLFQPDLTFDSFTYTLDVQEFSGECVASKMEISWNPGEVTRIITNFAPVTGDSDDRLILNAHLYFNDTGTIPMDIYFHVVILNSQGEIFRINEPRLYGSFREPYRAIYPPQEKHDKPLYLTYGWPDEDVSLPEELQDGFTLLVAVTSAKWDSTWTNQVA